jgi:hypothetical protein
MLDSTGAASISNDRPRATAESISPLSVMNFSLFFIFQPFHLFFFFFFRLFDCVLVSHFSIVISTLFPFLSLSLFFRCSFYYYISFFICVLGRSFSLTPGPAAFHKDKELRGGVGWEGGQAIHQIASHTECG